MDLTLLKDQVKEVSESISRSTLDDKMRSAGKKIAPVWPLENFVAVNPYLGFSDKHFEDTAQELAAVGNVQMTLPASYYTSKLENGELNKDILSFLLEKQGINSSTEDFVKKVLDEEVAANSSKKINTVADISIDVTGKDWERFMVSRISHWAAAFYDLGQASWNTSVKRKSPFESWVQEASIDATPKFTGLPGFRKAVKTLPLDPIDATYFALRKLQINDAVLPTYLHALLIRMGGWAAHAARIDWDSELYGGEDGQIIEFLAILVCWEACLLDCVRHPFMKQRWKEAREEIQKFVDDSPVDEKLSRKLILHEALDLSAQNLIIEKFSKGGEKKEQQKKQAKAQAIFCIDVRSEVFRRNLESVDSDFETLGFAGFFAFPINYVQIGHDEGEAQCPVLLPTGPTISEEAVNQSDTFLIRKKRALVRQIQQMWKSFKSSAITCFSFVSPIGLSYLPKLFSDSFGYTRPVPHPDQIGLSGDQLRNRTVNLKEDTFRDVTTGIPINQQIEMAENALKAMSLSDDFARFVLITGHGSSTVNNPYATGLDCGACGGHTGEANAKVAAAVLNNIQVRLALVKRGINIPSSTVFLACLHDTTTDQVTIYNEYEVPQKAKEEFKSVKRSLALAGHASRTERALRMSDTGQSSVDANIIGRSKDWSQTRPEWGLAGCSAFVVAPRKRTQGLDFKGRSFLHSYKWQEDKDFAVLELIMTAPMVVTSWISLQYFASTVDNKIHGSGNKTLHNVTAGIGVLEGYSGDLRVGLPIQSVHDGENYQHDPVRLNVVIEAPIDAMTAILRKHESVKHLCDNGWLNLLALDHHGIVSHRYAGDLKWDKIK
ncbi:MAG: DUF2309 domain-containing protein [Bacteroidota bacterium]